MLSFVKYRKFLLVAVGAASVSGLSSGCASIPTFGGNSEIAAKYQDQIDNISDFPSASKIISRPVNEKTQAQWDAKAKTLIALEQVFTEAESRSYRDSVGIQAYANELRTKLNAYQLDDY